MHCHRTVKQCDKCSLSDIVECHETLDYYPMKECGKRANIFGLKLTLL